MQLLLLLEQFYSENTNVTLMKVYNTIIKCTSFTRKMIRFAPNQLFRNSKTLISSSWTKIAACTCVVFDTNGFCTAAESSTTGGGIAVNSTASIVDLGSLLETADKKNILPSTACFTVIAIAGLKKESKVSESEYLQDERFLKMMKTLEGTHTAKLDPLAIISSLKVRAACI